MNTAFEKLKKNRNNIEKLTKALEATQKKSYKEDDDRMWYPAIDKSGNGMAIIRFLPQKDPDAIGWVQRYNHGFQSESGAWYIENCPTTIGKECPCCEQNSALWKTGAKADQDIASARKRKLSYFANILVISDPGNPENEGKVKIFRFGKKIFEKISGAIDPEFEDETPFDPFDLWTGANFKLKIRNVDRQRNYDKSEFAACEQIAKTDEKIQEIWDQTYDLSEFVAETEFKPYDELSTRLKKVLGVAVKASKEDSEQTEDVDTQFTEEELSEDVADDDSLEYFQSIANGGK